MKRLLRIKVFYLTFLLSLCSIFAKAQVPPDTVLILGPDTVCQGNEYDYYVDTTGLPTGGTWFQINQYGNIVNSVTYYAKVRWGSIGNGQLIFRQHNLGGTTTHIGIKNVHILAGPQPVITTNFKVKCQKPGRTDITEFQGFDRSECIRVCAYN